MQDDKDKDKGLRKLDPATLRDVFNLEKEKFRETSDKEGVLTALSGLSEILGDLQDAGLDVSLEMLGGASEQAFDLFKENGVTAPVSGVLRIGPIHRLLGIATRLDSKPSLVIALSEFDIRYSGPEAVVNNGVIDGKLRAVRFDLKKDPDALVKLESTIIRYAARNDVIAEIDHKNAFDNSKNAQNTLRKLPLKPPPKP